MAFKLILCGVLTFVAVTAIPGLGEDKEIHVGRREVSNTCTEGYEKLVNSTMCATDSPQYVAGSAGVSDADKTLIINQHNDFRRNVTPTATNMMKVYWDDELAKVAEKWARQCVAGHDSKLSMTRYIPKYGVGPGQNAAFGHQSWNSPVVNWHGEVSLYQYGKDPETYLGKDGWTKIGHYTQVVASSVVLVGCGYAQCTGGSERYYICNYLTGQIGVERPYVNGTSCAACPTSCKDNLCDCGNNFCFNGGTLDIDNCTCTCKFPFKGARCLENPCPGVTCENGGTLNVDTCKCNCLYPYTGDTCKEKSCGNTPDTGGCLSWPASYCEESSSYHRYVRKRCPVLCGICPAPCNGKVCQNGGTLDHEKCQCNCARFWSGDTCATKNCTGVTDISSCSSWSSYCEPSSPFYQYVLSRCPILCGFCPGTEGQ